MNLRGPGSAPARSLLLVGAFFLVFAAVQAGWLARDRRPVLEEKHLFATLRLAHTLRGDEVSRGYPDQGFRSPYPPLVVYLSAPVLALGGTNADLAVLTLLPFMALLLWSVWRAARFHHSPAAAAAAAVLALACQHYVVAEERYPPYSFLKEYLLDLPLSALTALTVALLLLLRERPTRPRQIALGLTMGLGALTKVTYPIYLAIILAALLIEDRRDWRRWREVLLPPALLGALAALPWYLLHFRDLGLDLAAREFSGDWAAECGKPPVLSVDGLLYYPRLLEPMLSLPLLLVIAAAVTIVLWRRSPGGRLAAGGLLVSYLALSVLLGKSERMLAPCLVFAALAVAGLVDRAPAGAWRAGLAALILAVSGYRAACLHGMVPWFRDRSGLTAADLAPLDDDWSVGRIMADLLAHRDPATLPRVSVVPHLGHLGHNALMQYALEHDLRISGEPEWGVRSPHWEREVALSEFILTKEGDNGPERFTPHRREIESWVAARLGDTVELTARYPLPDGTTASLYRQRRTFPTWERRDAPGTPEPLAVFGAGLALTDLRLDRDGALLRVRCEWLAGAVPRKEYRLFIQVRRGWRNLSAETFAPGAGLLPVIDWPPGSVLAEEYTLPFPAACAAAPCEVWLGWHRGGSRLPVTETALPRLLNAVRVGPAPS